MISYLIAAVVCFLVGALMLTVTSFGWLALVPFAALFYLALNSQGESL